jgi:ribosomal protein S9
MKGTRLDEQIFHEKLKKIRWSTDRDELVSAMQATLRLMLRRPTDEALLANLMAQADRITGGLPKGGGQAQAAAVRQAAIRCVVLLQKAKKERLSRVDDTARLEARRSRRLKIIGVLAIATIALYLFLLFPQKDAAPGIDVAKKVEAALHSSRLGLSRRGDIVIRATKDHTIVTVERMTPEECLVVANDVQNLGDLAINNNPAFHASGDTLKKMCSETADATLAVTLHNYRKK